MSTMPSRVRIRRATRRDRQAIDLLNAELQAHELPLRWSRAQPDALPPAYVDALYARQRTGRGDLLVAVEGRWVIGFAAFELGEDLLEKDPPEITVTDLVVTAAHRGKGVGRVMMTAVEDAARARGIRRLYVISLAANADTHSAYTAMGFEVTLVRFERVVGPVLDPSARDP
jgi:GNAT superfamily N-acetyltransferase